MTIKVTRNKKGKKVYISTKEDKLTNVKVYEPKDFFLRGVRKRSDCFSFSLSWLLGLVYR